MKAIKKYNDLDYKYANKTVKNFRWFSSNHPRFDQNRNKSMGKTGDQRRKDLSIINSSELWGKHYKTEIEQQSGLIQLSDLKIKEKYRKLRQEGNKMSSKIFQNIKKQRLSSAIQRYKQRQKNDNRHLKEIEPFEMMIIEKNGKVPTPDIKQIFPTKMLLDRVAKLFNLEPKPENFDESSISNMSNKSSKKSSKSRLGARKRQKRFSQLRINRRKSNFSMARNSIFMTQGIDFLPQAQPFSQEVSLNQEEASKIARKKQKLEKQKNREKQLSKWKMGQSSLFKTLQQNWNRNKQILKQGKKDKSSKNSSEGSIRLSRYQKRLLSQEMDAIGMLEELPQFKNNIDKTMAEDNNYRFFTEVIQDPLFGNIGC